MGGEVDADRQTRISDGDGGAFLTQAANSGDSVSGDFERFALLWVLLAALAHIVVAALAGAITLV